MRTILVAAALALVGLVAVLVAGAVGGPVGVVLAVGLVAAVGSRVLPT